MPMRWAERPLGLRLIVGYKFAKAFGLLGLALWLTIAPGSAYRSLDSLAREFAEGGFVWAGAGRWIHAHLTGRSIAQGAILAWLDTFVTAAEGALLLSGWPWAEWIVIFWIAALIPVEIVSLVHTPGALRAIILAVNAAVVVYLVRRRLLERPAVGPL